MIVVSDTSPLRYLVLLGRIELLPRLYRTVHCPSAVAAEAAHPSAPAALRELIKTPPAWLRIVEPVSVPAGLLAALDAGEAAAIALAEQEQAQVLLMDELRGRGIAESRGLLVAGTLNILADAATRGWLDYRETVQELRERTNFRASDRIVDLAFERMLRRGPKDGR